MSETAEVKAENGFGRAVERTDDVFADAVGIIERAQQAAHRAVNVALVQRNWLLGRRIAEEELKGGDRAEYGAQIIKALAKRLTEKYGHGFTKRALYDFLNFYRMFPDLLSRNAQSCEGDCAIVHSLSAQSAPLLTWTHYRILLRVPGKQAREWYAREAAEQMWSVRTLDRNVQTQYYHRMLHAQDKPALEASMERKAVIERNDKLEFIKNPVMAEFLGLSSNHELHETDLESAIIANLQQFMMEMGKGYAFVARQQHIRTQTQDFFIDLVFYNYILKCFVLIDLKTSKITHQDVGQMDMYVRMYDDLKRGEGDNPTLGLVLCTQTDEDIAKYSVLNGNEQLFAAQYQLYLPTEDELRAQIEAQKEMFELQQRMERI